MAVLVTRGEVSIPDKMSNLGCQINFMELIKGCLVWCTSVPEAPIAPWSRRGPAIVGNWSDLSPFGHFLIRQEFWDQVLAPDCVVRILSRDLSRDFNLSCSEYKYLEYGEGLRVKIFRVGSSVENHNSCLVLTSKLFL